MNETKTKRGQKSRQRAVGAGAKHKHSLKNRLVMTLFWLRVYMTYEVLGFFYELDKTKIEDNLKKVLATLDEITNYNYDNPRGTKPKLYSVSAVMEAFPDVRLVIDAKEQYILRPKNTKDQEYILRIWVYSKSALFLRLITHQRVLHHQELPKAIHNGLLFFYESYYPKETLHLIEKRCIY